MVVKHEYNDKCDICGFVALNDTGLKIHKTNKHNIATPRKDGRKNRSIKDTPKLPGSARNGPRTPLNNKCPHVADSSTPVFAICEKPCLGRQVCEKCAYGAHISLRHKLKEVEAS